MRPEWKDFVGGNAEEKIFFALLMEFCYERFMIRLKSERWRGCQGMPLLAALIAGGAVHGDVFNISHDGLIYLLQVNNHLGAGGPCSRGGGISLHRPR